MSEDKIEVTDVQPHEEVVLSTKRSNRLPIYIALTTLGIIAVIVLLIWTFRGGDAGRSVSAPQSVTFGDAPTNDTADIETLTIQPDQVDKIGLMIETVGETLSSEAMSVAATGVVRPDAYKETPVVTVVGGVIRRVVVELGQNVRAGQIVAVANSDDVAGAASVYISLLAESDEANKRYDRALKLTDIAQESRTELDQAAAAVTIAEAEHVEHQSHFNRTEKLVRIGAASREEFEIVRTRHETAQAKLIEAVSRLERAKKLLAINPQRRSELDSALTMKRSAEAKASAAREKLLVYGLLSPEADRIKATRIVTSELPVRSPVSGTVTSRSINPGEIVAANKEMLRVTDLGSIWVIAQVYEKDINQIRAGSGASVTTDAYSGRLFRGHVTYIDPNIDQATRTAQVRVELENPGQIIKIGMYVNVAFGSMGAAERTVPSVPSNAVQTIGDRKIVFTATESPNVFAIKTVRLGAETNGKFNILEGLNVGDNIVTEGSFLLRAELLKQNPSYR